MLIILRHFIVMDSPLKLPSKQQPRYSTIRYCFVVLLLYVLWSPGKFSSLQKRMHLVLSSQKWIDSLSSTYQSHTHRKFFIRNVFDFCNVFMLAKDLDIRLLIFPCTVCKPCFLKTFHLELSCDLFQPEILHSLVHCNRQIRGYLKKYCYQLRW